MIQNHILVYDLTTGEILRDVYCTDVTLPYQYNEAIEGFYQTKETVDPAKYYLPSGVLTERSKMSTSLDKSNITADGSDVATISGIPAGTAVYINMRFIETCDDGTVEISSTEAAHFRVVLECFPYQDREYIVHAS